MLSEDQLLELFIHQNIPPNGRHVVERIRTSQPVRRVGGGTHNVTVRFASQKMGCVIQAESHKAELPFVYMWEHDPNTHEFYDQPSQVKLSYKSRNGKKATHLSTPDYFIIDDNWMGWIEIKREEELLEMHASGSERFIPDGEGGWRCPPGEAYANEFGLGFKVLSTKEINWLLVRNLEFLSDYLQYELQPSQAALNIISGCFENVRWVLLQHLLELDGVSADDIFTLVAHQKLLVDLEEELLSEPKYTHVCLDELSLQVYQHQKAPSNQSATPLQSILLAPGTPISWDGKPWKIINVGSTDVFIESNDKEVLNIKFDVFQKLVATGSILGVHLEPDEGHQLAADKLNQASPVDLKAAVERIAYLNAAEVGESIIPDRTLRNWKKLAREGELIFGDGLVGLLPRISARGNRRRKIDPEVIASMNEIIDEEVLSNNQPIITICYGMLINLCKERGLQAPSERTFRNEISRRSNELIISARQGRKAAYSSTEFCWNLDQSTPKHGERPFEIGHIDHTEVDLELVHSQLGVNLGRAWLTLLIDAFTRVILAFYLTFDPPSYRSCMAVIKIAVQRHGRIPKNIVVDNGSEFESTYFEALIPRLNSNKKNRPKSKSRFGNVIERLFGISNKALIHNLAGNSQALQKPRSMSPSHDPRLLAVWTLSTFTDAFEEFAYTVYANIEHPALGISPNEMMARGLWLTGERKHTLFPFTETLNRMCMPTTDSGIAKVQPGRGIKIKGIFYWTEAFREPLVAGKKVDLVYDPFDVSRAYAFVKGEWMLCHSEYQPQFERRSEREIAIISREIRAQFKQAGTRRHVRASDLAAFITKLRKTEAVLRQQRNDAEHSTYVHSALAQQPPENQQPTSVDGDLWSTPISNETFEDLK